jgi:hypothetical protein
MAASSAGATTVTSKKALTIGLGTAFALAVLIAGPLLAFVPYQRRRFVRARSARPCDVTVISDHAYAYAYAAVSTGPAHAHAHTLDDLEYKHYDAAAVQHAQVPSNASSMVSSVGVGRNASTVGRSVSTVSSAPGRRARGAGLPTGAMPPAVPGPYVDRAPPEDEDADDDVSDADRAGAPLSRAPSSGFLFVVHPMDDDDGVSPGVSPPACSERQ